MYKMIMLDKERKLRFDYNALCDLEDILNKSVTDLFFNDNSNPGLKEIRAMTFCGLKWEDKKLTLIKTGKLIEEFGIDFITEKVMEAFKMSGLFKKDGKSEEEIEKN